MSDEGKIGRWLVVGAGVIVLATIAAAVFVMGLPSEQRDVRMDQKRVRDLRRLVEVVNSHVERQESLPPSLDALANQPGMRLSIADPVDGSPYTYEVIDKRKFRLCAVFATDTSVAPENNERWIDDEWPHAVGRRCFERRAGDKSED
jgi:hypothetical protein